MRYAILSDIHGNLEALNVALDICKKLDVDQYLCLGDLVGYNANPQECVDLVRALPNLTMVKGNHDEYISNGDNEMLGFNPHARDAVLWTRSQLSIESMEWLANLPYRVTVKPNITLVHATLDSPESWGYVFDLHHAKDNFSYQFSQFCFCGHSHSPLAFVKRPSFVSDNGPAVIDIPGWVNDNEENEINPDQLDQLAIQVQPSWKYLINVGSVGQPRNRDPRASFAVYDTDEKVILRIRAPYDFETTQKKIIDAGLPERLALRLARGT